MKKLIVVLMIGVGIFVFQKYKNPPFNWQQFSTAGCKCAILMPQPPLPKTTTKNTEAGPITTTVYMVGMGHDKAFGFSYAVMPAAVEQQIEQLPTEKVMAALRHSGEQALNRFGGGRLLHEIPYTLGDTYPGIEDVFELPNYAGGSLEVRSRAFQVNDRIYAILVVLPKDQIYSANANKFIDSFHLQ